MVLTLLTHEHIHHPITHPLRSHRHLASPQSPNAWSRERILKIVCPVSLIGMLEVDLSLRSLFSITFCTFFTFPSTSLFAIRFIARPCHKLIAKKKHTP